MYAIEFRCLDETKLYFRSSTSQPTNDIRLAKFFKSVGMAKVQFTACEGWSQYNFHKLQGSTVHMVEVDLDVTVLGDA